MAIRSGPGKWKTSPNFRFGVITASRGLFAKVVSSKWLNDEPPSYGEGVYRSGLTPLFARIALAPDQTSGSVNA